MFEDSLLIVAHPDDDILWLSSVVDKVDRVIFCFNDLPGDPDLGPARRATIAAYPLPDVITLDISEAGSFNKADWSQPVVTDYGIELGRDAAADRRYRTTWGEVASRLQEVVAGKRNIFTHNPWGEYGHEDHVLVYRALKSLQATSGFTLWFSNYASNRSVTLMNRYISGFSAEYNSLPTNRELARRIEAIYREHGCWTWYEDYEWFEQECLMMDRFHAHPPEAAGRGRLFPINYLKVDIGMGQPKPTVNPPAGVWGRLTRKIRKVL